jgi:large subunit ribosomal protein L22
METDVILRPSTRATVRYNGRSPYKVRHVINLIRGKQAEEAQNILLLCDRGAAEEVGKLLNSAIANAEHNNHIPAEELKISEAFVDEGPTSKRFKARARGRGNRILKRSSHITIVVERMDADEIAVKAQKDSDSGAANAREQRRRRTEASKAAAKAKQEELEASESDEESTTSDDASDSAPVATTTEATAVTEEAKPKKKPAAKKPAAKKADEADAEEKPKKKPAAKKPAAKKTEDKTEEKEGDA